MKMEGLFFLTFDEDGSCEWQGRVLGAVEDFQKGISEHFLVQLYDWLVGAPSVIKVVSGYEMTGARPISGGDRQWAFYETHEDWRAAAADAQARDAAA